jgi:hypothetical protein
MSAFQRRKGRTGQLEARHLLTGRDWSVAELNSGTCAEDFIAVDPTGRSFSVEVKNTVAITTAHRAQAMAQAKLRKLPWMLVSKIGGTSCWLIQRQGEKPVVWAGSDAADVA